MKDKKVELTEDRIREIIAEEICKKLEVTFENTGYESQGIQVKIEYDGTFICYENL